MIALLAEYSAQTKDLAATILITAGGLAAVAIWCMAYDIAWDRCSSDMEKFIAWCVMLSPFIALLIWSVVVVLS